MAVRQRQAVAPAVFFSASSFSGLTPLASGKRIFKEAVA
ncbi:hypothetical protein PANA5342_1161 [Pantoea ananatis LMG 5342]|nr:hypothetical protein PANA5342_1161 [Pantoea ananatis LMG 5342]